MEERDREEMQVVGTAEIFCLWLEINCFAGLVGIVSGMDLRSVGEKYLTKISEEHMAHVIKTYQPFLVEKTSCSSRKKTSTTVKSPVTGLVAVAATPAWTSQLPTLVKLVFLP